MTAAWFALATAILCLTAFIVVFATLNRYSGIRAGYELTTELAKVKAQLAEMHRQKHQAYYERNVVIAMFARVLLEEGLTGPFEDKETFFVGRGYDPHFKDWGTCLYIEPPQRYGIGQLNWHVKDAEAWLVNSLGLPEHPTGWDQRVREEKYAAIEGWLHRLGLADNDGKPYTSPWWHPDTMPELRR